MKYNRNVKAKTNANGPRRMIIYLYARIYHATLNLDRSIHVIPAKAYLQ